MIRWTVCYQPWMGFLAWWGGSLVALLLRVHGVVSPDCAKWLGAAAFLSAMALTRLLPPGPCLWWFEEDYDLKGDPR